MNTKETWKVGETRYFYFNTEDTDHEPITLAGSPVVSAYVGSAADPITTGITLDEAYDAIVGLHEVEVVTTAAAYPAESDVVFYLSAGTVDAISVVGKILREVRMVAADADGVVCGGTTAAGGAVGAFTLATVTHGALTNVQVGDIVKVAGLPGRGIKTYNSGTGAVTCDALVSDPSSLPFVVWGSAPKDAAADFSTTEKASLDTIGDTVATNYDAATGAEAAAILARTLAAASVTRIDAREATGATITVGAGTHTTTSCLASDSASGTRVKGRIGVVTSGTIINRGIRFTSDIGASGAFTYTDLYGAAVPVALAQNDTIQW